MYNYGLNGENQLQTIYMVITNRGDGSNGIEWHRTWSDEKHEKLEGEEAYQSGDGVQMRPLHVHNIKEFADANCIDFYEEYQDEFDDA